MLNHNRKQEAASAKKKKNDKTPVMEKSNNKILNIGKYQKTRTIENLQKRTNNLNIAQYIMLPK